MWILGLNLTFLRGLPLGLDVPLEYPKLSSSKSTVVGSGVDGDVGLLSLPHQFDDSPFR